MKWLVFDTETTGLTLHRRASISLQPRLIEFGGIVYAGDWEEVSRHSILVNPIVPITAEITKITGITSSLVENEPRWPAVSGDLRALFASVDVVIAHNLPFDKAIIDYEVQRHKQPDWPWPRFMICTAQEHEREWGRRPRLQELFEHYSGAKLIQEHRALSDVEALSFVARSAGLP